MIYLGKRVVPNFSTKQNINGKISTEDDLIGVDNDVAKIIWSRYFIYVHGHIIAQNKPM